MDLIFSIYVSSNFHPNSNISMSRDLNLTNTVNLPEEDSGQEMSLQSDWGTFVRSSGENWVWVKVFIVIPLKYSSWLTQIVL